MKFLMALLALLCIVAGSTSAEITKAELSKLLKEFPQADANGDGHYADDAALAGYTVISNVDSIELIQLSNIQCFGGGGSVMAVDLDSNGESTVPIVCPTGPGDIDRPPR